MNTKDYRTKTIIKDKTNPQVEGKWGMAIDIGYSAVKGFAPNRYYCFPFYARKITKAMLEGGGEENVEIRYYDNKTGEEWLVGAYAQEQMSIMETNETAEAMYGRKRYGTQMFKVITAVSLGLGMIPNSLGSPKGKELYLQTGLPPAYMDDDVELIDSLSGLYDFRLKIAKNDWIDLKFELKRENIYVMQQPLGTLFSVSRDAQGKSITNKYNRANTIICDIGFGTFDVFSCKGKTIDREASYDDLGMKAILTELCKEIKKNYRMDIPVPCMQKFLEKGTIPVFDRKSKKSDEVDISDMLKEASESICQKAIERLDNEFNYLMEYNYLILTGGTGSAWSSMIRDSYKNMNTLEIVSGNVNEDLPYIFANVRGYYMFLYNVLKRM